MVSHVLFLVHPSSTENIECSFVATVLHPVFFTAGVTRQIEIDTNDGTTWHAPKIVLGKVIRQYLDVPPYKGVAGYGQPAQQVSTRQGSPGACAHVGLLF